MALRDNFYKHSDGRVISFAQVSEDIIVARFFSEQEKGSYVDVGANHPTNDSVTKNLYKAGWRGINIEPISDFFSLFAKERPDDINLNIAISSNEGMQDFYLNKQNNDLSTLDIGRGTAHSESVEKIRVEVKTLTSVLNQFSPSSEIDFLKIDVEGHEKQVLFGIDFRKYRFNLICLETGDMREESNSILASVGYEARYFDGVNTWYTPRNSMFNNQAFQRPPSAVLDWFHPWIYLSQIQAQDELIKQLSK